MQHDRPASQTLDRGLRVLEHVVRANAPLAVADVARGVEIHRSVAYRMMRTLEDHGLLARDDLGRYVPGAGLAALSGQFRPRLRAAAARHLQRLVQQTGMTSFLVVRNGDDAVTIDVVEPPAGEAVISYRPGVTHPVHRGAPGLALLTGEPTQPGERREVIEGRRRGWVSSESEVIEGLRSVAAPVIDRSGRCRGALAVVFAGRADLPALGVVIAERAADLGGEL
ncbi:MAG: IclR family transcriptional regulator [Dermatophilaceae bacterium]